MKRIRIMDYIIMVNGALLFQFMGGFCVQLELLFFIYDVDESLMFV